MDQTTLMPDVAPTPPQKSMTGTAECTVNTRDLLKEMNLLQRVVARKTTAPILTHLHLQAVGKNLVLTATDARISLRTLCTAQVKKEGRFTIPAHKFYDYLRLLAEGELTFKALENHWVQIRSGRSHTKMVGMSPENFPKLPLFPVASAIKLGAQPIRALISRTVFAVSSEESRYILNGALLLLKPDGLTMVATDGHRLAHAEYRKPQTVTKELRVLLPKTVLDELSSLLNANSAEHIQFADDNSTLYFAVGSRLLTSQLMSGKFPNYEVVLPKGEAKKVIVSRQELLLSLQRVAQFADSKSNAVRVRIAPNELRLCSSSSEIGESEDVVPTTFAGPPKLIGYNSQYLLDFLRVVDCENVCLEFKVEELPTEFKPEDADKDFSLRCVIMPLKI